MVVMKFGGSSVQDKAAVRRVIEIVGREKRPRLVVVSALSRVTDGLLEIASLAERREADAAFQRAERDDARAGLELREEEHLVDQLPNLVDLPPRLLDERVHVLPG